MADNGAVSPRVSGAALTAVPVVLGVVASLAGWPIGIDSAVYRAGAVSLVHGWPLYGGSAPVDAGFVALPYTYPPASVLAFLPLALFPASLAWGLLGACSLAALVWIVHLARGAGRLTPSTVGLAALFVLVEPVFRTVSLGQVNLLLVALVMADVLVARRSGGVLIGVAAAIKLTPLIFVGHLIAVGRWRDAGRAVAVFVGLQASMLLVAPSDVTTYWRRLVFSAAGAGNVRWSDNQSLYGLLLRLVLPAWTWVAVAVALAPPAWWLVRRLRRGGDALGALLVSAGFGLLISPVSWTHHWVWCVPLIVVLWTRATTTAERVAVGALCAVFGSWSVLALPGGRDPAGGWSVLDAVLGNVYLLAAFAVIAVVLARTRRVAVAAAG